MYYLYDAIKGAMDNFANEHDMSSSTEYVAQEMGFNGPNRNIQLLNKLNPHNNKFLKVDELLHMIKILHPFGVDIVEAIANDNGCTLKNIEVSKNSQNVIECVGSGGLKLQSLLGVLSAEIVRDIEDGEIDYDEAIRLKKALSNLKKHILIMESKLDQIIKM